MEARVGKEPGVKLAFCGVRKQTLTHDFVPYSGSHEREGEDSAWLWGECGGHLCSPGGINVAGISTRSRSDGQRGKTKLQSTCPARHAGRKAGQHGSPLIWRNPRSIHVHFVNLG